MKTILYITEESPFPPYGGGKIRRQSILKALSVSGNRVHAIIANKFQANLDHFKLENVTLHEFNEKPGKLHAISRYFKIFHKNRKRLALIKKLLAAEPIDLAFLDCYFIGQYISFFKKRKIPVILGTENAQSRLNRVRPAKNLLRKLEKYTNYILQVIHERLFFNRADAVIVVSENDRLFYKKFVEENKLHILPNFLEFTKYTPTGEKGSYVIMTGSFKSFQNQWGLTWFLENVWDEELSRCTRLLVAGDYSGEFFEKIKRKHKHKNFQGVQVLGQVKDLNPHISQALVSVVPLLHGSGSRVKILEAMALETLVISTTKGAEGIEHENSIIIADRAEDLKKEILKVIKGNKPGNYKALAEKAYQVALKKYSFEVNRLKLQEILDHETLHK